MNTVEFLLVLNALQLIPVMTQNSFFIERPTSVNASLGMIAVFRCLPSQRGPGDVVWRVNGTYVNNLRADDISTNITTTVNGTHNCLYIQASEERNNTVIECVLPDSGDGKYGESNATLTVQGTLASVGGLTAVPREGSLHLTWHPPFTLDITNMTPDILYCINIYNISHNSQHDLILNNCSLIQPEFVFRVITPSPCDQFKVEVIPVNGAGNGTSNNITGYLFEAPTLQVAPAIEVAMISDDIIAKFSFPETSHICVWRLYVNSSDDLPGISPQLPDIPGSLNTTGFNVTIKSQTLPFDRNYSIAVEGKNSAGKDLSQKLRLSTYDVQKTTSVSDSMRAGRLIINCEFASNSSALGWLSIVRGKSSRNESFHVARRSNNTLSIGNLDSDNYTVVTFDIEHNGLPGNHSAYIERVELQNGLNIESAEDHSADTGGTVLGPFINGTLCLICNFTSGCIVLIHSTSNPEHLGVHITRPMSSPEGLVQKCINTSICSTSNCTAGVYKRNTDGIIDQPEPVTMISTGQEPMAPALPPVTDKTPSSAVVIVAAIVPLALLITVAIVVVTTVTAIVIAKRNRKVTVLVLSEEDSKRTQDTDGTRLTIANHHSPNRNTISDVATLTAYQSSKQEEKAPDCSGEEIALWRNPSEHERGDKTESCHCQDSCSVTPTGASASASHSLVEDGKKVIQTVQSDLETFHEKPKAPSQDVRVQYQTVLPQAQVTHLTSSLLPVKNVLPEMTPPKSPSSTKVPLAADEGSASQVSFPPEKKLHDETSFNKNTDAGMIETSPMSPSSEKMPLAVHEEHHLHAKSTKKRPKTALPQFKPEQGMKLQDMEIGNHSTDHQVRTHTEFNDEQPKVQVQKFLPTRPRQLAWEEKNSEQ